MTPDIRIGDVWRSEKGGRLVTVAPVTDYRWYDATDNRDVAYRGTTGAVMVALAANFVKGRVLWERAGVRVGDVRRDGLGHYRVDGLTADHAGVDGPDGWTTKRLDYLAQCRLVERDGKAV